MVVQTVTPTWEQHLYRLAHDALCFASDGMSSSNEARTPEDLRKANQECEAITKHHSRSFYLASGLLPDEKRKAMRSLYAYCRTADNLADGDVNQPEVKLRQLREGIRSGRKMAGDAVLTAWADIHVRYQIPLCYAEQLLDGVERDLIQTRYDTFEDLSVYCYNVASTVGLMSMHITGFSSQDALPYAIKLGVALQLTNILRDVGEDWLAGRLYLPLEELRLFQLDEKDIGAKTVDDRWRAFMRFQIARARRLYAEAMPGIAFLHPDGRFAVAAAAILYQGILDDIERHDFAVFERRAYVNRGLKLIALMRAFWFSKRIRAPKIGNQEIERDPQDSSQEGNYGL